MYMSFPANNSHTFASVKKITGKTTVDNLEKLTCFTNINFYGYEKETHDGCSASGSVDSGSVRGRQ